MPHPPRITHICEKPQQRFADNEKVYKTFLEILNSYRKGQRAIGHVYEEVSLLFNKHPDLLEEFTYFLPDSAPPQVCCCMGGGGVFCGKTLYGWW